MNENDPKRKKTKLTTLLSTAKIMSKNRIIIPLQVRNAMQLEESDVVIFLEAPDKSIILRKVEVN